MWLVDSWTPTESTTPTVDRGTSDARPSRQHEAIVKALASDMAETIVAQQAELITLRACLARSEKRIDQLELLEWPKECLYELHQLRLEFECIGGGPDYAKRLIKVWADVDDIFQP